MEGRPNLRLVALVCAFIAESPFPKPNKMPVPCEKNPAQVDRQGVVDVSPAKLDGLRLEGSDIRNKIIHTILNPWILLCCEQRRSPLHAKDGIGVVDSLIGCHRPPVDIRWFVLFGSPYHSCRTASLPGSHTPCPMAPAKNLPITQVIRPRWNLIALVRRKARGFANEVGSATYLSGKSLSGPCRAGWDRGGFHTGSAILVAQGSVLIAVRLNMLSSNRIIEYATVRRTDNLFVIGQVWSSWSPRASLKQ